MNKRYALLGGVPVHTNTHTFESICTCSQTQAAPVIDEALEGAIRTLQEGVIDGNDDEDEDDEGPVGIHVTGVWVLQIHVEGETGGVSRIDVLADTLVSGAAVGFAVIAGAQMRGVHIGVRKEWAAYPDAEDARLR